MRRSASGRISIVVMVAVAASLSLVACDKAAANKPANAATGNARSGAAADRAIVERNKASFVRFTQVGPSSGDLAALSTLFDAHIVDHQSYGPGFPSSFEGLKAMISVLRTAFPDLHTTVGEVVGVGDYTWARVFTTGTNTGSYLGIPPTGRKVGTDVFDEVKWDRATGKAVEHWGVSDNLTLLAELGFLPPNAVPAYRPALTDPKFQPYLGPVAGTSAAPSATPTTTG
ncbi:MAG: hypothetical protein QOE15_1904 [Acidimicrobiaceae bacterium]|nr:hypothetical protein [Acidimicrobiaceae bacterium]